LRVWGGVGLLLLVQGAVNNECNASSSTGCNVCELCCKS
jgi:hypothetical protein